jgi:ribosome-interacting GTPase 1
VHRDLARRLTGARVWSDSAGQPGQTVSSDHMLSDGDVVELLTT